MRGANRPLLIDTDGYIGGGAARAYKSEILNVVRPDLVVLLEKGAELEYFKLYVQKGFQVCWHFSFMPSHVRSLLLTFSRLPPPLLYY